MTEVKRLQKNVVLAIYILCFAEATLNHSLDFLRGDGYRTGQAQFLCGSFGQYWLYSIPS
jgi:hypothetical protein